MNRYSNTMIGGYGLNKRRDGRNTYGSKGGYVDSRRDYNDYNRDYRGDYNDYRRDYNDYNDYNKNGTNYDYRSDYDYADYDYQQDMDMRSRGYDQRMDGGYPGFTRGYAGHYGNTPFEIMQSGQYDPRMMGMMDGRQDYVDYNNNMRDYRDYHSQKNLRREDLEMWSQKLLRKVDEKEKDLFRKEKILKKAEEMGIRFEEFNPEEFYTTVLMVYTDYCKTMGNANPDLYVRIAKDWLMDDDSAYRGGEKLSAYYHHIIKP